jgi:hypothetical protein
MTNLVHCQDKIDNFEMTQQGLWHHDKAHAELGHEIWEQEQREAEKDAILCEFCQQAFKKRGLTNHQKHCKSKSTK